MKREILHLIGDDAHRSALSEIASEVTLENLPVVNEILREELLSIEPLERLEEILKAILRKAMSAPMSGCDARKLASAMKEQGLLLKYKPYAIKAASPFGYSIFLQRPGEGFSYQNHLTHKTEVFHILEVLAGGFVFLCHYEDWQRHYEKATFERWLSGTPHPLFDSCKFLPQPGDVFVIAELGIVLTVIGCILEEFATVSTDMVQRLHDQNDRRQVPPFPIEETRKRLDRLRLPESGRRVDMLGESIAWETIPRTDQAYGHSLEFVDSFVKARHVEVKPNTTVPAERDQSRATVIRVFGGQFDLALRDEAEHRNQGAVELISMKAGDITAIPPGIYVEIQNTAKVPLAYSEHRIEPSVALQ